MGIRFTVMGIYVADNMEEPYIMRITGWVNPLWRRIFFFWESFLAEDFAPRDAAAGVPASKLKALITQITAWS